MTPEEHLAGLFGVAEDQQKAAQEILGDLVRERAKLTAAIEAIKDASSDLQTTTGSATSKAVTETLAKAPQAAVAALNPPRWHWRLPPARCLAPAPGSPGSSPWCSSSPARPRLPPTTSSAASRYRIAPRSRSTAPSSRCSDRRKPNWRRTSRSWPSAAGGSSCPLAARRTGCACRSRPSKAMRQCKPSSTGHG